MPFQALPLPHSPPLYSACGPTGDKSRHSAYRRYNALVSQERDLRGRSHRQDTARHSVHSEYNPQSGHRNPRAPAALFIGAGLPGRVGSFVFFDSSFCRICPANSRSIASPFCPDAPHQTGVLPSAPRPRQPPRQSGTPPCALCRQAQPAYPHKRDSHIRKPEPHAHRMPAAD